VKRFPHKPGAKDLAASRQKDQARYQSLLAGLPKALADKNESRFFGAWLLATDLASLAYALDDSLDDARKLLRASSQHIERAIEFGYTLNPAYFALFLCIANVCDHHELRRRLEKMKRPQYTDATMVAKEILYISDEIMADLSAGRSKEAKARLPLALACAEREGLSPEVQIEKATIEKDLNAFDIALESKIKHHIEHYSRSAVRDYPGGLIDLVALGMVKIAERHGLKTAVESVYLPLELLTG